MVDTLSGAWGPDPYQARAEDPEQFLADELRVRRRAGLGKFVSKKHDLQLPRRDSAADRRYAACALTAILSHRFGVVVEQPQ
jgi:hypothetical protein